MYLTKPHWKKCRAERSHRRTPTLAGRKPKYPSCHPPHWPSGCDRTRSPLACTRGSGWGTVSCTSQGSSLLHQAQSSSHHLAPYLVCSLPEAWGHSRECLRSEGVWNIYWMKFTQQRPPIKFYEANTALPPNPSLECCYYHSAGKERYLLHPSWTAILLCRAVTDLVHHTGDNIVGLGEKGCP